jgi:phytoene synthase
MPSTPSTTAERTTDALPQPLYDLWDPRLRPPIRALWHWHSALAAAQPVASNGTAASLDAFYAEERERAAEGAPMRLLREAVWEDAYAACDSFDLDRELLARQVEAAQRLHGTTRFAEASALKAFVQRWAVSHGRLLAGLAGADNTFQVGYVEELSRGFFHVRRLLTLPDDVAQGRLFLAMEDLNQAGVTVDQLRKGMVDEGMQRLLWKQAVRIRDALAQGQPLMNELSLRLRLALKFWWLAALEMVNEVERRDFDLWSEPVKLSAFRRAHVYLQTAFGRARAS